MVKLFRKNSNLCDHNSPTLQTDRQTDRQTTCDGNTALCTKVHRAVKTPLTIPGHCCLFQTIFILYRRVHCYSLSHTMYIGWLRQQITCRYYYVGHVLFMHHVWACEHYRIRPLHFLAEFRKRRLNLGSFVLLCPCIVCFFFWVVFSLCILICLLFCIFSMNQCKWHCIASLCWCAVKNLLAHSLTHSLTL